MLCREHAALWSGISLPMIVVLLLPAVDIPLREHTQELLIVIIVLWFLIGALGVITLRVMSWLREKHGIPSAEAYLSSGPFLGQLERLTYTVALLTNFEAFIAIWIGLKTFPQWAARKFNRNRHAWAISLSGNLMNILGAVIATFLIRHCAPSVCEFMSRFGG